MFESALEILNILNKNYDAYIIGGYPRDYLFGIETDDIDITTSALPDDIKKIFNVVKDNSQYGSLVINYKDYNYEITTFRIDKEYNGRYPKIEYTNDIKKDLYRRDFTINTICINKDNQIIDLIGGIKDLKEKKIKCIGNPEIRLKEDPIRILRAIRLAGKLEFQIDNDLDKAILNNKELLKKISKKQLKREINKMNDRSIDLLHNYQIKEVV